VQHISLQLFNKHHQINFAVQVNACTGWNGSTVARQKDNQSGEVSWVNFCG